MKNSSPLIASICDQTGLSRRKLSRLLKVHHSRLVKHEAGTLSLSTEAMLTLAAMHNSLNNISPAALQPLTNGAIEALQQQCDRSRSLAMLEENKLAAILNRYQQAGMLLQLLESEPVSATGMLQCSASFIEELKYQAICTMENNNLQIQLQLQIKIAGLMQEANILENKLITMQYIRSP